MSEPNTSTAGFIVIGNEILSGRTAEKNTSSIAKTLTEIGVRLSEVRVIPDDKQTIIDVVREYSERFTYVFTSGGIGPTHDDITAESVSEAMAAPLELNEVAHQTLEAYYKEREQEMNEARKKMAYVPVGAELVSNPVSAAPGFIIDNVHVLAGVPSIFTAMVDELKARLQGGEPIKSRSLVINVSESVVADGVTKVQNAHDDVEIGSYPHVRNDGLGVALVIRSTGIAAIDQVHKELEAVVKKAGGKVVSVEN